MNHLQNTCVLSTCCVCHHQAAAARPSDNAKGSFQLHLLERAGHNLHMDNAQGLHDLLLSHIMRGLKQPQQ